MPQAKVGRPFPHQKCPFPRGSEPPSNTWFPRPIRVLNPNSISNGSAIFADRQTDHTTQSVTTVLRCGLIIITIKKRTSPSGYSLIADVGKFILKQQQCLLYISIIAYQQWPKRPRNQNVPYGSRWGSKTSPYGMASRPNISLRPHDDHPQVTRQHRCYTR